MFWSTDCRLCIIFWKISIYMLYLQFLCKKIIFKKRDCLCLNRLRSTYVSVDGWPQRNVTFSIHPCRAGFLCRCAGVICRAGPVCLFFLFCCLCMRAFPVSAQLSPGRTQPNKKETDAASSYPFVKKGSWRCTSLPSSASSSSRPLLLFPPASSSLCTSLLWKIKQEN